MDHVPSAIAILKVLCDETRLRILSLLSSREMSGCEINRSFCCSQPTISYHMKLLVDAKLVDARKEGCSVIYSVNADIWPHLESLLNAFCLAAEKEKTSNE